MVLNQRGDWGGGVIGDRVPRVGRTEGARRGPTSVSVVESKGTDPRAGN